MALILSQIQLCMSLMLVRYCTIEVTVHVEKFHSLLHIILHVTLVSKISKESGTHFLKVPVTFGVRMQIFKSKPVEFQT